MAKTLRVEIVSAEDEIWSGDASFISASAQMGDVGIAPGHSAFMSRIKPGEVRVKGADGEDDVDIYVSGGMMEVQPHIVTILADTALRGDDIDEAAAQKAKEEAEAILTGAPQDDVDYGAIQQQLAEASAQLELVKKLRRNT